MICGKTIRESTEAGETILYLTLHVWEEELLN